MDMLMWDMEGTEPTRDINMMMEGIAVEGVNKPM
jgi:hypothetical protein